MNFEGKRLFITKYDGLNFIEQLLINEQIGQSTKLVRRILSLLYDLIICDSKTFEKEDPTYVRKHVTAAQGLLMWMAARIQIPELAKSQMLDIREQILRILMYCINFKPDLIADYQDILVKHKQALQETIQEEKDADRRELLGREVKLVEQVLVAKSLDVQ